PRKRPIDFAWAASLPRVVRVRFLFLFVYRRAGDGGQPERGEKGRNAGLAVPDRPERLRRHPGQTGRGVVEFVLRPSGHHPGNGGDVATWRSDGGRIVPSLAVIAEYAPVLTGSGHLRFDPQPQRAESNVRDHFHDSRGGLRSVFGRVCTGIMAPVSLRARSRGEADAHGQSGFWLRRDPVWRDSDAFVRERLVLVVALVCPSVQLGTSCCGQPGPSLDLANA